MVTLAILASFFGGVIVGAILLATYRGSVVVEVPVIVPAPEICAAATTGIADADTGAPGANEVSVNILYR